MHSIAYPAKQCICFKGPKKIDNSIPGQCYTLAFWSIQVNNKYLLKIAFFYFLRFAVHGNG